jgi:hypothetical protein
MDGFREDSRKGRRTMLHLLARYPLLGSPRTLPALSTQDASAGIDIPSNPRR